MSTDNLQLIYTILCDDVRLEMGNKLSLMGVFQNMMVERTPVSLIKFAVVQHWRGEGSYIAEVRVLSPDKMQVLMASQPTQIVLSDGGFADNVSFFINAVFPTAGTYWLQTLVNSNLFDEFTINVKEVNQISELNSDNDEFPEIVQ
ncbi:MAG: hypothetical protein ABI954_15890 [Pyrinomonadaceae bacterium]